MSDGTTFFGQEPDPGDYGDHGDQGDQGEPLGFADVMNGLTLGSGKRRRPTRPEPQFEPPPPPVPPPIPAQDSPMAPPVPDVFTTVTDVPVIDPDVGDDRRWPAPLDDDSAADASFVRPYAWTGGRTKSSVELRVESLLTTTGRATDGRTRLQAEHRVVADLCDKPRSVAEVASLMDVPFGVAKVLLGDMAELGLVTVHKTANANPGGGNASHLKLMERVLSGLRRL